MDFKPFIPAYITRWASYIRDLEEYKWIAFRHFRDFYYDATIPFGVRIKLSFSKAGNLLVAPNYFAYGMITRLSEERPADMEGLLTGLFNEKLPLKERIETYRKKTDGLMWQLADAGYGNWKGRTNLQTYQDVHAISVYLAMRYPEKYYIYKSSVFKAFADATGYTINSKKPIDKLIEFNGICERVKQEIVQENTFLTVYNDWLKDKGYEDSNYCLLTQDFIYAVGRYLTVKDNDTKKEDKKELVKDVITADTKDFKKAVEIKIKTFRASNKDYESIDKLRRGLGLEGELWVMQYEKDRLEKLGIQNIVKHISILEGDGAGYDILSVEDDGITPRYIEVKTTTGNCNQPLFYSKNEMELSQLYRKHYYLYRVYDFKDKNKPARLMILKGGLDDLNGTPISYKASIEI